MPFLWVGRNFLKVFWSFIFQADLDKFLRSPWIHMLPLTQLDKKHLNFLGKNAFYKWRLCRCRPPSDLTPALGHYSSLEPLEGIQSSKSNEGIVFNVFKVKQNICLAFTWNDKAHHCPLQMRMYWGAWTFNLNGTYFCIWRKTPCHRGPNVGYLDLKKFRVKPNTITTITMMHCFFQTSSVCLWIQLLDHIWSLLQENSSKVTNMHSEVLSARWSRPYWGAASTCGATTAFFY